MLPFNDTEYTHEFSRSGIRINLRRNQLSMLQGRYYFPTFVFALLALVSYAIDFQNVPGRLGLLVTLYLMLINVYLSVEGPKSRGFSNIELWSCCIQIPLLVGILEYGILLAMKKYVGGRRPKITKVNSQQNKAQETFSDCEEKAKKIDKLTFIGCLTYILLFFTIYWLSKKWVPMIKSTTPCCDKNLDVLNESTLCTNSE